MKFELGVSLWNFQVAEFEFKVSFSIQLPGVLLRGLGPIDSSSSESLFVGFLKR